MMGTTKHKDFLSSRHGRLTVGFVSLVLAVLVGMRALNTGSLQQYGLVIVLLVFGINRVLSAIHS